MCGSDPWLAAPGPASWFLRPAGCAPRDCESAQAGTLRSRPAASVLAHISVWSPTWPTFLPQVPIAPPLSSTAVSPSQPVLVVPELACRRIQQRYWPRLVASAMHQQTNLTHSRPCLSWPTTIKCILHVGENMCRTASTTSARALLCRRASSSPRLYLSLHLTASFIAYSVLLYRPLLVKPARHLPASRDFQDIPEPD